MRTNTYITSVNVAVACGVVSAFFYDSAGQYKWIALGVAMVSALFAIFAYFRFHWSTRPESVNLEETNVREIISTAANVVVKGEPTSRLSSVPAPTYVIPVGGRIISTPIVITENGDVRRVNVDELLTCLKIMEKQGWSAPEFPLSIQREFRSGPVDRWNAMSRNKQPTYKARFRAAAVNF